MSIETTITRLSSTAFRIISYIFLRWFPGPELLPAAAFALLAVYIPSFFRSYFSQLSYEIVDDHVDVLVKETPASRHGAPHGEFQDGNEDAPDLVIEELGVQETVVVKPRSARPFSTLLLGSPSPTSSFLSLATFLINVTLALMCADFILSTRLYHPCNDLSFVRLGYVSDSEANFLIREPDQSEMPLSLDIRIKHPHPPFDNPRWQLGGEVRRTSSLTDHTATIKVPLKHSQQRIYEWRTSNNHSGEFLAAPKPGGVPDYNNGNFTFLATSCILPRFPYSPSNEPLAIPGLRYLADLLPGLRAQFMLFMGDFIYADVPRRWGTTKEDYRQKYRHVYASPDWLPASQNLSWIHVFDDHEIENDWSSNTTGVYESAMEPWHIYNNAVNPPPARMAGTTASREGATYFEFTQGPASFFMLDTRTYRSSNHAAQDDPDKTMLGKAQLEDFIYWLNRPEPEGVKWKVVASSVPFTKNWPVNNKDTWGGFLSERRSVLEAMWDAGTRGMGVVIVSGDRHEFAATTFPPPPGSKWPREVAPYEFSASPLSQFSSPLPSYKQHDDEDVMLGYINRGSSKFGALTIHNAIAEPGQSSLHYRLFIDGVERWNITVSSPPAPEGSKKPGSFWNIFKQM